MPSKETGKTVCLDVRDLEPCEPMIKILEAVEELSEKDRILALHRQEPHPLFSILKKRGVRFSCEKKSDDLFEILIWKKN